MTCTKYTFQKKKCLQCPYGVLIEKNYKQKNIYIFFRAKKQHRIPRA